MLTGGTGFLGSRLLQKLLFNNHTVIILKRSFSDLVRINEYIKNPNVILFDIDKKNIEEIFRQQTIDCIIHTATEYGRNGAHISQVMEVNLIYPIRLIELGIKYNVNCFINTDSFFTKNSNSLPHLKNYTLSKRNLSDWLKIFSKNIKILNLSLEHVYGPNDNDSKFVERMIRDIAIKKITHVPLTVGNQKRDFIYIDDVADAYLVILGEMKNIASGYSLFEVGTGSSIPVRRMVEMIKLISGSPTVLGFGEIISKNDEIMDSWANNKSLVELGWSSTISLEDGIKRIID